MKLKQFNWKHRHVQRIWALLSLLRHQRTNNAVSLLNNDSTKPCSYKACHFAGLLDAFQKTEKQKLLYYASLKSQRGITGKFV